MGKFIIDKTFSFCYGHRVWTQTLNGNFAADLKCACRHLHGHEGTMHVFLTAPQLDATNMVTDFRHLEWLKKWIDTNIDHQFIIDRADPLYDTMIGAHRRLVPVMVPDTDHCAAHKIDLADLTPGTPEYEYYEGFLVVPFTPTSERLSAWMAEIAEVKMAKLGVSVHHIDWWETPKSRSTFYTE